MRIFRRTTSQLASPCSLSPSLICASCGPGTERSRTEHSSLCYYNKDNDCRLFLPRCFYHWPSSYFHSHWIFTSPCLHEYTVVNRKSDYFYPVLVRILIATINRLWLDPICSQVCFKSYVFVFIVPIQLSLITTVANATFLILVSFLHSYSRISVDNCSDWITVDFINLSSDCDGIYCFKYPSLLFSSFNIFYCTKSHFTSLSFLSLLSPLFPSLPFLHTQRHRHALATTHIFRSIMTGHEEVNVSKAVSVGMENTGGEK